MWTNITLKGKILYLRDFIWCFIFFRRACQAFLGILHANAFLGILKFLRAFMFKCSGKIREISENECSRK